MAKPMSFKDFLPVDYVPGEDDQIKLNAVKRKKHIPTGNTGEEVENEALSLAQRRKKSIQMKRLKARIAIGRKKAARRMASMPTLKNRAQKQARNLIFKKLSKGKPRSEVSPQRRAEIEKRLNKLKGRIGMIAKRILPKVRKMEVDRKKGKKPEATKTSGF